MENKINIAELLKDCPKGMELDCVMYVNPVRLEEVTIDERYPISIKLKNDDLMTLTEYGSYDYVEDAKCIIFPKGKITWEGFHRPFKDGDILVVADTIYIYNGMEELSPYPIHYVYVITDNNGLFAINKSTKSYGARFATEEEKQKLFDAIRVNGYKWNAETKTLEKLVVPKFKVGDSIREKNNKYATFVISNIDDSCYYCGQYVICSKCYQDNWELVPDKFDITTLKPFDKVLVRDGAGFWRPTLFGMDMVVGYRYFTASGSYKKCIPFKDNEHLLGTTNDCDDFYKTWEK